MDIIKETENKNNPISKRIAVRIDAKLAAPALIGSGEDENTDYDVLRGYDNEPYLPGTSLAGVLRSRLTEIDAAGVNKIFGDAVIPGDKKSDEKISALWVMDSRFKNSRTIELDGVALDYDNKVAKKTSKYDFEAVDIGTAFRIRMMLVIREDDAADNLENLLDLLLSEIACGNISVGAKSNRGFGRVSCEADDINTKTFDFSCDGKKALAAYEEFSWDSNGGWKKFDNIQNSISGNVAITKKLRLNGSIMIRDTRNLSDKNEDYRHISILTPDGKSPVPVIYGTSWAGAFRSGLYRLLKSIHGDNTERYLNEYFGYVSGNKTLPSKIKFDMSILEPEDEKYDGYRTITRVKIDRFTGGASDGALFTETPWYGGTTALTVRYPKDCKEAGKLLELAFDALDKGLLTVGGETAVGRGVFQVIEEGCE